MDKQQEISSLTKVSQVVGELVLEMRMLANSARDDELGGVVSSIRRCCLLTNLCLEPIERDGAIFASFGSPSEMVTICGRIYESAHHAAVLEACELLAQLLNRIALEGQKEKYLFKCRESLDSKLRRDKESPDTSENGLFTDFVPEAVYDNWELTRQAITDLLTPEWYRAAYTLLRRIARERARYESECNSPTDGEPASPTESEENPEGNAAWHHSESDVRPPEYTSGPLQGTLKDTSRWAGEEDGNGRKIKQMAKAGYVWVRKHNRTNYSVWFRDGRTYAHANQKKISEGRGPGINSDKI